MNEKVSSVIDKIKSKYASVDTILLFGSTTSADWTSASDIDIFLIDPTFNDEREDIIMDDIVVEVQKDNLDNIKRDMENERGQLLNRNVSTMIADATIISSQSLPEIQSLQSLAKEVLNSASTYTDEDIKMWQYSIKDYLSKAAKDLARGDKIAFYLDTHYILQNALEMSLATHGAYLPQPKNLATVLQSIDPTFYQIFLDFTSATDSSNKLQILQQLAK